MSEITTITSEALQAEIRRLLPSQRGFGSDLEASNVIVPTIDLTPTAEGSGLRTDLQTASSFGSINYSRRDNEGTGSTTVVESPGFYKYNLYMCLLTTGIASSHEVGLIIQRGGDSTTLHELRNNAGNENEAMTLFATETVYLRANDSLKVRSVGTDTYIGCSAWQVADVYGNLTNPSGFTFE